MSYNNITDALTKSGESYVNSNWVHSDKTTFIKKHVLARGAHFLLAPTAFITTAVDTIIGLGVGLGAICMLEKHRPTTKFAFEHLKNSNELLAFPYSNFLRVINPEAEFGDVSGFFVASIVAPLAKIGERCKNSDNFLMRHVVSRLTYALLTVACLITRVVDGVIAIPAVCLSILTVGKFQSINNIAYKTLKAPGIINDLFTLVVLVINPKA